MVNGNALRAERMIVPGEMPYAASAERRRALSL
jgi:hypothetical protein